MPFKQQVGAKLWNEFPFAVLSNVPLYRSDLPEDRLAGYEIDHLLHSRTPLLDRLFIIECKEPPVCGAHQHQPPRADGPWFIERPDGRKNCKRQVENHARALMSYLRGLPRELQIEAWIVSRD